MDKGRSKHRTKKCRQLYVQLENTKNSFDTLDPDVETLEELKRLKKVFVLEKKASAQLVIDIIGPILGFVEKANLQHLSDRDKNFLGKF